MVDEILVITEVVNKVAVNDGPSKLTLASEGPQGPPGPRGPAGSASTSMAFNVPSSSWIVNHNLGHYPLTLVYVNGQEVITDVINNSVDSFTVTFATPQVGIVVYS